MIDQKIGRIHNACDDAVQFDFECDTRWSAKAVCTHGEFTATSNGPADLETAVAKLLKKFMESHGIAAETETH